MTWTSFAGMDNAYIDHDTREIWTAVRGSCGGTVIGGRDGFEVWPLMSFEVHGGE